jgi:hypothetical protein
MPWLHPRGVSAPLKAPWAVRGWMAVFRMDWRARSIPVCASSNAALLPSWPRCNIRATAKGQSSCNLAHKKCACDALYAFVSTFVQPKPLLFLLHQAIAGFCTCLCAASRSRTGVSGVCVCVCVCSRKSIHLNVYRKPSSPHSRSSAERKTPCLRSPLPSTVIQRTRNRAGSRLASVHATACAASSLTRHWTRRRYARVGSTRRGRARGHGFCPPDLGMFRGGWGDSVWFRSRVIRSA